MSDEIPTPDEAGLTIVREGRFTSADGLVLEDASEISCGCIMGTRERNGIKGFILRACGNPKCPVYAYFTKMAQAKGKPLGFGMGKKDADEIHDAFTRGRGR